MAGATNEQVIRELRRLKRRLSQRLGVDRLILFGSRARGQELLTSDVDVVVVSEGFRETPFRRRHEKVLELWPDLVDLEVLCYTPEEFDRLRQRVGIVKQASQEGIEI